MISHDITWYHMISYDIIWYQKKNIKKIKKIFFYFFCKKYFFEKRFLRFYWAFGIILRDFMDISVFIRFLYYKITKFKFKITCLTILNYQKSILGLTFNISVYLDDNIIMYHKNNILNLLLSIIEDRQFFKFCKKVTERPHKHAPGPSKSKTLYAYLVLLNSCKSWKNFHKAPLH